MDTKPQRDPAQAEGDKWARFLPRRRPLYKRVLGRVLKRLLELRYRGFKPGAQPAHWTKVAGIKLRISRGVFDPKVHFATDLLCLYLRRPGVVRGESRVLDLGTGSGALAIAAGMAGSGRVLATDINAAAVRCARGNVRRQGLERTIEVRQGDMFGPLGSEQFSLIVCNPPYFRGAPYDLAEQAYYAGEHYEWLDRFSAEAAQYLAPGGKVLVVLGDAASIPEVLEHLASTAWIVRLVARRDILVETLFVFELAPRSVTMDEGSL